MDWERHDASLVTATCRDVANRDPAEEGRLDQMGQDRLWEVVEAPRRLSGPLDVGSLDAERCVELVGGCLRAAHRD